MKRSRPLFPEIPSPYPPHLSFLLNLSPSAMTLGLGNIKRLLSELDHPEKEFHSIVVAGTNGKGTVTACLSSILNDSGVLCGRFVSPHVYSVTERVNVGEVAVSMAEMEQAASRITALYDKINFSYFEALTAIAFLIFAEKRVEYAVLEVGLGGRFDATNAVDPVLCVLTNISLDHRRILGDSEEEILREKLGITRHGVPLVCGILPDALIGIMNERAVRDNFPVYGVKDIGRVSVKGMSFESIEVHLITGKADYGSISLPFPGIHQAENALLAAGAAEMILGTVPNLKSALEKAYLPGRFEFFPIGQKKLVLDVAHNDHSLSASARTLASLSPRENNAIVLGVMRRKELTDFPALVPSLAQRLYLVEPVEGEGYSPQELLAIFAPEHLKSKCMDVIVAGEVLRGDAGIRFMDRLLHPSAPCGAVLITGSHKTVEMMGSLLTRKGLL